MKTRIILLVALFALVSTTTVSAQFYKCKKVAITEVVDRSENGDLSNGTKAFIRSALTDAITASEGYEGYTTISFTTLEMNFDRTGNISSATLTYVKKQMMEYILVAEVTPLDKSTALLSARIVETSSGKLTKYQAYHGDYALELNMEQHNISRTSKRTADRKTVKNVDESYNEYEFIIQTNVEPWSEYLERKAAKKAKRDAKGKKKQSVDELM